MISSVSHKTLKLHLKQPEPFYNLLLHRFLPSRSAPVADRWIKPHAPPASIIGFPETVSVQCDSLLTEMWQEGDNHGHKYAGKEVFNAEEEVESAHDSNSIDVDSCTTCTGTIASVDSKSSVSGNSGMSNVYRVDSEMNVNMALHRDVIVGSNQLVDDELEYCTPVGSIRICICCHHIDGILIKASCDGSGLMKSSSRAQWQQSEQGVDKKDPTQKICSEISSDKEDPE
ncbi:hypothetical protein AKJ16_DCAP15492 [Drosera capensis]